MRWVQYLVLALLGAITAQYITEKTVAKIEEHFEVVVFTISLCDQCAIFETDILKEYKSHELSKSAPLVRVNIDDEGTGSYHLKRPITHVPTTIVMKNGQEVGRVSGLIDKIYFYVFVRDKLFPLKKLALQTEKP